MSEFRSQPISTRLPPAQEKNLLPVGDTLAPASGDGAFRNLDDSAGDELNREVAQHLARAVAQSRELATAAKAMVAEHGPAVQEKLQDLGGQFVDNARRTMKETNEMLSDADKRRGAWNTHRRKILIGGAAVLAVLAGGWLYGKHEATRIARDHIDNFLLQNNLQGTVTYAGLSASPFGSVDLSDVKVVMSPGTAIGIGDVDVSDIDIKNNHLDRLTLSLNSVSIPLLALARQEHGVSGWSDALGLGYTTLTADGGLAVRYEEGKGIFHLDADGKVKDLGSWKFSVEFSGVSPSALDALASLSQAARSQSALALLGAAGQGLQGLAQASLNQAELTIDNTGFHKRSTQVTDQDVPLDGDPAIAARRDIPTQADLERMGMPSDDARDAAAAFASWLKTGGTLHMATHLDGPLPLFRSGNIFMPAFGETASFLARARVKVSN